MFYKKLIYFMFILAFGACSGSQDTAEIILDSFPQPKIGNEAGLVQQKVPNNVPSLKKGQNYYGLYPLELNKKYDFVINESETSAIIDLEYQSKEYKVLNINDLAVFALGECSDFSTTYTWYIMGSKNEVLSSEKIEILSSFVVFEGERAILRITHSDTTGCSSISTQISVDEIK